MRLLVTVIEAGGGVNSQCSNNRNEKIEANKSGRLLVTVIEVEGGHLPVLINDN